MRTLVRQNVPSPDAYCLPYVRHLFCSSNAFALRRSFAE